MCKKYLILLTFLIIKLAVFSQDIVSETALSHLSSPDTIYNNTDTCLIDTIYIETPILPEFQKQINLKFKPTQLIAPLSLIAVGTFGYYSGAFHQLNRNVQKGMANLRGDRYLHFDDWIQYIPAAGYLALGFYRDKRRIDFKERIVVEATAYISMTALVNIAKYSFKEKRPDSNARNSFPSGHTATAFTGAELIRSEFGWGMGSVAYVISTGVAFLRLYNDRHWLNDVIAGAGIGILSARIGYWMLPLYRKWFHWNPKPNSSYLITTPLLSSHSVSINLLYTF